MEDAGQHQCGEEKDTQWGEDRTERDATRETKLERERHEPRVIGRDAKREIERERERERERGGDAKRERVVIAGNSRNWWWCG